MLLLRSVDYQYLRVYTDFSKRLKRMETYASHHN
jgi:hypothetical protein